MIMMISTVPISVGFIALLGFYQLLKPRIPRYSIQVRSIFPTYITKTADTTMTTTATTILDDDPVTNITSSTYTTTTTSSSSSSSSFAYEVSANVKMYNDNFITIDIYSLTFDMFYPDFNDELRHVAQITDTRQYSPTWWSWGASSPSSGDSDHDDDDDDDEDERSTRNDRKRSTGRGDAVTQTNTEHATENDNTNKKERTTSKNKKSKRRRTRKSPMWSLNPRSDFIIDDRMYMIMYGGASTMMSLSYDAVRNLGGTIQVPLTGVLHLLANGIVPITLSIICNNDVETFSLTVNGRNCELDNLIPGWKEMDQESSRLRSRLDGTKYLIDGEP